jgi:hypothetical protein
MADTEAPGKNTELRFVGGTPIAWVALLISLSTNLLQCKNNLDQQDQFKTRWSEEQGKISSERAKLNSEREKIDLERKKLLSEMEEARLGAISNAQRVSALIAALNRIGRDVAGLDSSIRQNESFIKLQEERFNRQLRDGDRSQADATAKDIALMEEQIKNAAAQRAELITRRRELEALYGCK